MSDKDLGTDGPQTGLPAAQELLPCPFCGGEAFIDAEKFSYTQPGVVKCRDCGCAYSTWATDAGDAWNTRVAPTLSGAEAEIARLKEALHKIGYAPKDPKDGIGPTLRECIVIARTALGAP